MRPDGDNRPVSVSDDVETRREVAHHLTERRDSIVADTVATFPLSRGSRRLDADYCVRLGNQVVRSLRDAVCEGPLDSRGPSISDLTAIVTEREVSPDQLFLFVHIAMDRAIDEVSNDQLADTNAEEPLAAQFIRRAAFDVLAAWTTRSVYIPMRSAIEDPLTTLHTRPVLDAVLPKECRRAERFEHWLSLVLIDIDNLSAINKGHGYGVGDRILERMGMLLRAYFRANDWVIRYAGDTIAVLLPETDPSHAVPLAERTRSMLQERLTFRDYRTAQRASVTVSVAAVSTCAAAGAPIDHEKFLQQAEAALERAKAERHNRVETAEPQPPSTATYDS